MTIVLASASPRRFELLRSLALDVHVAESGYSEDSYFDRPPRELALTHARGKLASALTKLGRVDVPVVSADTVVDVDGLPYGKPRSAEHAREMLRTLAGRTHEVHTAFAVAYRGTSVAQASTTRVTFFPIDDSEIDAYVESKEPMDKAGAYGIQGFGATLVERIEGDFYTVMGLPLASLVRTLRRLGFRLNPAN